MQGKVALKILFISSDYYGRRIKYADSMLGLGHEIIVVRTGKDKITPDMFDGTDIVWAQKYNHIKNKIISPDNLSIIKKKNIPIIAYHTCEKHRTLKETVEILKPYSLVFECNEELAGRLNELDNSDKFTFLPLGYHPDQYFPLDIEPKLESSFAGRDMSNRPKELDLRVQHLKYAMKHFNVRVYGKGLCKKMGLKMRPFRTHEEQREIYAKTMVNLNFPWCNTMIPDFEGVVHANNRFFEITASKRLALTAYSKSLDGLLKEGVDTLYYHDKDDMIDKIRFMINNYEQLNSVREAGYCRCVKEHTFKHRIEKIISITRKRLGI